MIFDTREIVAWCSRFCTLLPGDVILTGSPPGVGCFQTPPQFLQVFGFYYYLPISTKWYFDSKNKIISFQKGDVVECWIEKIGSITNKII